MIASTTNKTLNSDSEDYEWVDEGMVIESRGLRITTASTESDSG